MTDITRPVVQPPAAGTRSRRIAPLSEFRHTLTASPRGSVLLLVDLRQFKVVNEILSPTASDEVIRTIADRLVDALDRCDLGMRSGTSWLILQHSGTPEPHVRAHMLREIVATPVDVGDASVTVHATVAWVWLSGNADPVRSADLALLEASRREPMPLPRLEPTRRE